MARLGRGRREGARVSHNRSVPTPTPLVRQRLTQSPIAARRAHLLTRIWRRKRAHVFLRSPLPFFQPRQPKPVVSRADVRASARVRFFQPRGAKIIRAASTPTATPLVRRRVVVETTLVSRSRIVARLRHRQARVVRSPMPQPVPFSRPQITVVARRSAQRVRYTRRHHIILLRAPVVAPVAVKPPRPVVVRNRRAATARAFYGRRHARILRTPVLATQTARTIKPVLVVHPRRHAVAARVRRRDPILLRASYATPTSTPLVRKRVVIETQTGNRTRVATRFRHHGQAYLVRPHGGSAATVITGFFGPPNPGAARFDGTAAVDAFTGGPADGELAGVPGGNTFGPSNPGRS